MKKNKNNTKKARKKGIHAVKVGGKWYPYRQGQQVDLRHGFDQKKAAIQHMLRGKANAPK